MKWPSEHARAAGERFVTANRNANGESTSVDFTDDIVDPSYEEQPLMTVLTGKLEINNLAML